MIGQRVASRSITFLPPKDVTGTEQELSTIDAKKLGYPESITISLSFKNHAADGGTWGLIYLQDGMTDNDLSPVSIRHIQSNLPDLKFESDKAVCKYKKANIDSLDQTNIDIYYVGGQRYIKVFLNHYNSTGKVAMFVIGYNPQYEKLKTA